MQPMFQWSWLVFLKCMQSHISTVCNQNKLLRKKSKIFQIGFNRFMNDVKMMLGKRAAEYYLFATWCIIAPILMLVS